LVGFLERDLYSFVFNFLDDGTMAENAEAGVSGIDAHLDLALMRVEVLLVRRYQRGFHRLQKRFGRDLLLAGDLLERIEEVSTHGSFSLFSSYSIRSCMPETNDSRPCRRPG